MSFLNGAELIMNFPRASAKETRALAHAERQSAKRARSPSRVLVAQALALWRERSGFVAQANVYPEHCPVSGASREDFTAQVKWAKEYLAQN